jgi:tetratricopeptide (TPR) repeat protein
MKLAQMALAVALLSAPLCAQRHKLGTINTETPEGQLLAQIGQEADEGKKLAMMEDFAGKYPKHEALGWVYEQTYQAYQKANQLDKGLAVCDKLLTLDPEDARSAHGCLKIAEATKNPDTVKTWSTRTSEIARKVAASPKPSAEDEVETWKERVDFAKQFDVYTVYTMYAAALATPDAKKKGELMEAIEQRDEKYEHLPALRDHVFRSLLAANDIAGAQAMADKMVDKGLAGEDMLLVSADAAFNKKDYDRTQSCATKVVTAVSGKAKPDGMSDADWEARKNNLLGRAYWLEGVSYGIQNKHAQADKTLRAGVPFMTGNDQLLAGAYFYLGLANFKMGDTKVPDEKRILDALKFNEQCAAIKGPFQAPAQRNIKAIRQQFHIK